MTLEQKRQLILFAQALNNFTKAAQHLTRIWEESQDVIEDLDENILIFEYPFDKSFDELTANLYEYSENVTEHIESLTETKINRNPD